MRNKGIFAAGKDHSGMIIDRCSLEWTASFFSPNASSKIAAMLCEKLAAQGNYHELRQ